MHILYAVQTRTHPGKVRENNEDAFGVVLDWREKLGLTDEDLLQRGHLFAVADGMGGHAAGEVASQMAIETLFTEYYTGEWTGPKRTLSAAIAAANRAIFETAEANAQMEGMGTTLAAALYRPEQGLVANVGDSRAYLFRSGRIKQVTRDHSWVAEQVHSGILTEDEAAHHPFRNVITRSLGNEAHVEPEFFELLPLPGDALLLCSDGLSNQVTDKEMADILRTYPLDEAADRLLELALERGAPDNVTLVLIQMQSAPRRRSRSFLPWLALVAAIVILGGFVFWTFGRNSTQSEPTPEPSAVALGTFTPVVTPKPPERTSPLPTPKPTPEPPPAKDAAVSPPKNTILPSEIATIGIEDAVSVAAPTSPDAPPLVYVSGSAAIEAITENEGFDALVITSGGETFSATLDKSHYVSIPSSITGGRLALVGFEREDRDGHVLDPVLLLAPFNSGKQFVVLWKKDDRAIATFRDRFELSKEPTTEESDAVILQLK